ncbi:hypothetical protein MXD61_14250 [Frankia sp. AgPm24]|nr:hypothetical protein [Frankia sp. AgPm24]
MVSPKRSLSRNAVRSVVRRWEKAGVVQADPVLAGEGRLVRLTAEGALLVSDDTAGGLLAMAETPTRAVRQALASRVRLRIERSGVSTLRAHGWVSERQWRLENAATVTAGDHVPHGIALLDGGVAAMVHVTRTAVELNRLRLLLAEIHRRYPFVIVAVPADLTDVTRLLAIASADKAAGSAGSAGSATRLEVIRF